MCTTTSDSHMNNEGSHDASEWGALWVRSESATPELQNCNDATSSGVYVVGAVTTYCDADTDGGGWELFLHTDNGQIPGPLTESGGSLDPLLRRGQANTALGDLVSGFPDGSVEIAIAWRCITCVAEYQQLRGSCRIFSPSATVRAYFRPFSQWKLRK